MRKLTSYGKSISPSRKNPPTIPLIDIDTTLSSQLLKNSNSDKAVPSTSTSADSNVISQSTESQSTAPSNPLTVPISNISSNSAETSISTSQPNILLSASLSSEKSAEKPTENPAKSTEPALVTEILEAMGKRDKKIADKQQKVSVCLSTLGSMLSNLLKGVTLDSLTLISNLSDIGRILIDLQCDVTLTRRLIISSNLNSAMKETLNATTADEWLFGKDLGDTLKTAKSLKRSSKDLNPLESDLETPLLDEEDYFNVDISTGVVTINPIDRDTLKRDVFQFVIIAFEKKDISSTVNATIIVIVEDINDHEPEISPETLSITIKEGKYTTLEFEQPVMITDPDLAENAQYSVHLTDGSDYNWHSAFLIVPNTGYQNTYFTISVRDALLLDYENENWRNIKIEIQATEVANQSHVGRRIISIDLENLNDEFPIFENNSLTVSIPEDVENNYYICTMLATDRDVNDTVKHSIVGQKGFKISESTGVITTALDESIHLNYESMPVIILQVIATDLANHTTYAILTINVIDVNDIPPKLYLPTKKASLIEELPINSTIDYMIQTTDPDSDAKLIFSIDWDSTTALKNSVEVDPSYYCRHLDIVTNYPKKQTGYAEGNISISRRIDYEALDVIFLTVVVTDLNTVHNANSTL
ncbi:hypothetical protein KQX54_001655, partial [Cotesia glomerata]